MNINDLKNKLRLLPEMKAELVKLLDELNIRRERAGLKAVDISKARIQHAGSDILSDIAIYSSELILPIKALRDDIRQIEGILSQLKPLERNILTLHYMEGRQYGEIADILHYDTTYLRSISRLAIEKGAFATQIRNVSYKNPLNLKKKGNILYK